MSLVADSRDRSSVRRIGGIPIRNLYVMLAFADALQGELSAATCGAIDRDEFPLDILARLLVEKLGWIRRRGTPRRYRVRDDVGPIPEGTIDLATTLRGMHLVHDRLAFQVDELQTDTPQNRLLGAGVRALLRSTKVHSALRDALRHQLGALAGVSYITHHEALRVDWTLRDAAYASYGAALGLARLAVLATLPDESAHDQHWQKLLDDQDRMGQLFEGFICGFLRVEFAGRGTVTKPRFRWSDPTSATHALLPELRTDLMIDVHGSPSLTVGECKLYKSPLNEVSGGRRLRAEHVNQLFAYLAAARVQHRDRTIEGLLIYGLVDEPFACDLELREYPVRVRTLDLHLPWAELREQLVALWPV